MRLGIAAVILLSLYELLRPSPQAQLAAIDAAHSIPDKENAAFVYARLLPESMRPSCLSDFMVPPKDEVPSIYEAYRQSARGSTSGFRYIWEDPAFKEFVQKNIDSINVLKDASEVQTCYFPVCRSSSEKTLRSVLLEVIEESRWLCMMAATVDLKEGRPTEALVKARTLIAVGQHLCQQPTRECLASGSLIERRGMHILNGYLVCWNTTPSDLDAFQDSCGSLEDRWDSMQGPLARVDKLYHEIDRRNRPLEERFNNTMEPISECIDAVIAGPGSIERSYIKNRYRRWINKLRYGCIDIRQAGHSNYQVLSERKGHRIIIELTRLKNQAGDWPDSLDPLQSLLPADALIDPLSQKPFVYKRVGNSFALYGVGSNGMDDNGRSYSSESDDNPIWLSDWEKFYNPKSETQEAP